MNFCDFRHNKFEFPRRNTITSLLHRDAEEPTTGGTEAATQQTLSGQFLVTFQRTKNMQVSSSVFCQKMGSLVGSSGWMRERKGNSIKGKNLDRSTCRQPDPGVESGAPCTLSRHLVHPMQKHARNWACKVDTPVQKGFNARRCPDSSVGRAGD